jgi:ribosome production factor 1
MDHSSIGAVQTFSEPLFCAGDRLSLMVDPAPGEIRQEQKREFDPTFIDSDDPELLEETSCDTLASFYSGLVEPKIKITTSGDEESPLLPFGECLQILIPHSQFECRTPGTSFADVRNSAIADSFTDLLVLVSANHEVHTLMHLHLPDGPSAEWRVTSIVLPKSIPDHATTSAHYPELIMKRFETRIGKLCSRLLRVLFPLQPDFVGRRVVTFHHQRDFVFFRHYRYVFESTENARLQEAGPRFTLKLLWLQEGPFDPSNGQYTFYRRGRHEKSRLKWWL